MSATPSIGIIAVNYNSAAFIGEFLDYADRLDEFIDAGDMEGFFSMFFRVPPERADRLRSNPKWDEWVSFAEATAADRRA